MGNCSTSVFTIESQNELNQALSEEIQLLVKGIALTFLKPELHSVIIKLLGIRAILKKHYHKLLTHGNYLVQTQITQTPYEIQLSEEYIKGEYLELQETKLFLVQIFKKRSGIIFYSKKTLDKFIDNKRNYQDTWEEFVHLKWILKKYVKQGKTIQEIAEIVDINCSLAKYERFLRKIASKTTYVIINWKPISTIKTLKRKAATPTSPTRHSERTPSTFRAASLKVISETPLES